MFGTAKKMYPAVVAGFVALAALAACGGEQSVASKSAAAFREAQKKGETFEGAEHSHGHGAITPGEGHEMPEPSPGANAEGMAGEGMAGMAGMDHSGMAHQGKEGMAGMNHSHMTHTGKEGMAGMDHSGMADDANDGMAGMDHSGMAHGEKEGMAGMDHSAGHEMGHTMPPAIPAPALQVPAAGQPARTLRPDALDAPAATSVLDAQRSAEMSQEMPGMAGGGHEGHGAHGSGTYRQLDAGRRPEAGQGSEPQTPAAEPHHHEGTATPPPSGQEGEHSHHPPGIGAADQRRKG